MSSPSPTLPRTSSDPGPSNKPKKEKKEKKAKKEKEKVRFSLSTALASGNVEYLAAHHVADLASVHDEEEPGCSGSVPESFLKLLNKPFLNF